MEDYFLLLLLVAALFTALAIGILINQKVKLERAFQELESGQITSRDAKRLALYKSIKLIQWRDSYCIDHDVIDDDHRTLFDLINRFSINIPKFITARHLMPFMISLKEYTQEHFVREEELQKASGYAFINDHHEKHKKLIRDLDAIILKAETATEDTISDVALEINEFLHNWLLNHVLKEDLILQPYVERMREQASGMKPLRRSPRRKQSR